MKETPCTRTSALPPYPEHELSVVSFLRHSSVQSIYLSRLTTLSGEKFGPKLWSDVIVVEDKRTSTPANKAVALEKSIEQGASSQMIFPKLPKESPYASVHEEILAAAPVVPAPISNNELGDDFDEFVNEPLDDIESEDGFNTDDEYDVLDASDEEYLAQQGKPVKN